MRRLAIAIACLGLVTACGGGSEEPSAPTSPAQPEAPAPTPEPPTPPETPEPPAATGGPPDAARGATHYATYCASCHGPAGAGDGPVSAGLNPKPAKHSDAAYMGALTDEYLFQVVKEGGAAVGKSPLMAAWGGTLSDADIHDVVAFMRTLAE